MAVLTRIRWLGEQARQLKKELGSAAAGADAVVYRELAARLARLREQRRHLEVLREEAWRRKMIALGHLEEDTTEAARPCAFDQPAVL